MAFTVDSSTARITEVVVDYDLDGTIRVVEVAGEVNRADGTTGERARALVNVTIPSGTALHTQLGNLAATALTRLKQDRRWV